MVEEEAPGVPGLDETAPGYRIVKLLLITSLILALAGGFWLSGLVARALNSSLGDVASLAIAALAFLPCVYVLFATLFVVLGFAAMLLLPHRFRQPPEELM